MYLGDYVTLEQGTGLVHSSPAYGVEDFQSCRRYGMKDDDMLNPVQGDGRYARALPFFGGLSIWKANPLIVDKLREVGALLHTEKFTHSYMHCWRHKTPIIYRATTQWFAGMDDVPGYNGKKPAESLRETALRGIEATHVLPRVGQGAAARHDRAPARLDAVAAAAVGRAAAVLRRPRDRSAASGHDGTARTCRIEGGARRHRVVVRSHGTKTSASTTRSTASSPTRSTCGSTRAPRSKRCWAVPTAARRRMGSHSAQTGFPADLYLEGSDQHRGWFHSSLLESCMVNGTPPYKALLTHGFVVDGEGKKMSKSKGNVVAPQKVSETLGAEVLRLWVAATDYSGELSISDEILKRVVESYRRIRNTLRFLLANTSDFDAARDAVPVARDVRDRPLRAGAGADARHRGGGGLRPLRVPSRRAAAADVLLRGTRRLLPRRAEGPPVHGGCRPAARGGRRRRRWR